MSSDPGSVVIPAYQAEATIRVLVQAVRRLGWPVIVVDDASSDRTGQEAQAGGARVLRRPVNGGKGAALRDGWAEALRLNSRWIMTLDADGQHIPSEIPRFLEVMEKERADLVVGNRMGDPRGMPWERRWTNRFMSWLISRVIHQKIPDTQCGFRLITRRVLEKVRLVSEHFEIDSELVIRARQAGFKVRSVPVTSIYRREISFIHPVRDAFRFLRFIRHFF